MPILPLLLLACRSDSGPAYCVDRVDDADCDGVPDGLDLCAATPAGVLTDRVGCSENQASGCMVTLVSPKDREKRQGDQTFRWSGDCDVYLLQVSDDPAFPAGRTRTLVRTSAQEVTATADARYWRVVGADDGYSVGWTTEPWELR